MKFTHLIKGMSQVNKGVKLLLGHSFKVEILLLALGIHKLASVNNKQSLLFWETPYKTGILKKKFYH